MSMKRFFILFLTFSLLLSFGTGTGAVAEDNYSIPRAVTVEAIFLCRLTGYYNASIRLLTYAVQDAGSVYFGEKSAFSRQLSASEPLKTIAEQAYQANQSEQTGTVSFYGTDSDLAYAVGLATYSLQLKVAESGNIVTFLISDRYDFNGIRKANTLGALLNNLGYRLQCKGLLHTYDWTAKVIIRLDG